MRTLYLARHGEADGGDLTAAGREQATLLGGRLAGAALTAVHHSPLPRAAQTAELVAASLGNVPLRPCELVADHPPYLPEPAELPPAFRPAALRHLADYTEANVPRARRSPPAPSPSSPPRATTTGASWSSRTARSCAGSSARHSTRRGGAGSASTPPTRA